VDAASATRLALLDGFSLQLRGEALRTTDEGLPRGVQRLVAHLCLSGRPARTAIAGQLWPDVPEAHAQGSLRSALWRLHRAAPGIVQASAGGVRLAGDVLVDVRELSAAGDGPGCGGRRRRGTRCRVPR
jgi:DNA-binding SARP family transcriptional activator